MQTDYGKAIPDIGTNIAKIGVLGKELVQNREREKERDVRRAERSVQAEGGDLEEWKLEIHINLFWLPVSLSCKLM